MDQLDIQCDVGGIYDPEKRRFDHHQKSFETHWYSDLTEEEMKDKVPVTKLSSAGLIYKHFGKEVIQNICKNEYEIDLNEEEIDLVHEKLYKSFILEIDAIDNGVNQGQDLTYAIGTDLASRVNCFNSPWNAPKEAGLC